MKTIFIHDTNALRNLIEGQYYSNLIPMATELRKRAAEKNAENHMNLLTTMELMRHFDESDPAYTRCLKALVLQFHMTIQEKADGGQTIDFIPPWNPLLTQHFFGKNSDFMIHYYRIMEIANITTKNGDPGDWKNDPKEVKDIAIISEQLLYDRTEIRDNFEGLIKFINNGEIEWNLRDKKLPGKKKMLDDIKSGKMTGTMAVGLMRRAHNILDFPFPQLDMEGKLNSFIQYWLPVLNMNTLLIQKFLGGMSTLKDPAHTSWNTLNDMQFLAGACYVAHRERNNDVRVVIVTDDKGFNLACKGTYMEGNVWTVNDYQAFIY